jgi:hypothetical protein
LAGKDHRHRVDVVFAAPAAAGVSVATFDHEKAAGDTGGSSSCCYALG